MHFNLSFFPLLHINIVIFSDIFALFLVLNFKTDVLIAQKNLLVECLLQGCDPQIGQANNRLMEEATT